MMQSKVEICGVNTAKLPVLKSAETRKLLEQARQGDDLARQELQGVLGELETQRSLVHALQERSDALSAENSSLQENLARQKAQNQQEKTEIEQLGSLLTQAEEALAGTDALYQEASRDLQAALRRSAESEAELLAAQQQLTAVEEDYAGASALLAESEGEIARARELAMSHYHSAEAAKQAADEKAARTVADAIGSLSSSAGLGDKTAIEAARKAYKEREGRGEGGAVPAQRARILVP